MAWGQFIEAVRFRINILAGDDHLRELVQQLQLMGEVICNITKAEKIGPQEPEFDCSDMSLFLQTKTSVFVNKIYFNRQKFSQRCR